MSPLNSASTTHSQQTGAAARKKSGARRGQFLKWLRKVHGWVGLWGAVLGLLFGASGILQDHKMILRIKTPAPVRSTIQLDLPTEHPKNAKEMGAWLKSSLALPAGAEARIRREPAQTVVWGEREVQQPEQWEIRFMAPHYNVLAEYWKGSNVVKITRTDNGFLAIAQNFHRSMGVGVVWVLLADSIGGSMILLSITGVILWSELNRRRLLGFSIFAASIAAMLSALAQSM